MDEIVSNCSWTSRINWRKLEWRKNELKSNKINLFLCGGVVGEVGNKVVRSVFTSPKIHQGYTVYLTPFCTGFWTYVYPRIVPVFNSNEHFEIITNEVRSRVMYIEYRKLRTVHNKKINRNHLFYFSCLIKSRSGITICNFILMYNPIRLYIFQFFICQSSPPFFEVNLHSQ